MKTVFPLFLVVVLYAIPHSLAAAEDGKSDTAKGGEVIAHWVRYKQLTDEETQYVNVLKVSHKGCVGINQFFNKPFVTVDTFPDRKVEREVYYAANRVLQIDRIVEHHIEEDCSLFPVTTTEYSLISSIGRCNYNQTLSAGNCDTARHTGAPPYQYPPPYKKLAQMQKTGSDFRHFLENGGEAGLPSADGNTDFKPLNEKKTILGRNCRIFRYNYPQPLKEGALDSLEFCFGDPTDNGKSPFPIIPSHIAYVFGMVLFYKGPDLKAEAAEIVLNKRVPASLFSIPSGLKHTPSPQGDLDCRMVECGVLSLPRSQKP